jgi:hypothetical protein
MIIHSVYIWHMEEQVLVFGLGPITLVIMLLILEVMIMIVQLMKLDKQQINFGVFVK